MTEETLTVSQLVASADRAVTTAFPRPVWVRGEITGLRRTSRGAAFFRLADASEDDTALEVAARGRVMHDVDRALDAAGLGALRDGVEARVQGTVGIDRRQSRLRLSLLRVDPEFTAGRLAMARAEVLRRMTADGSLAANEQVEVPLLPLDVGLVTSRGSAAHADFLDQLRASGYRFRVRTAHTPVQGETAPDAVARAIERVAAEEVDVLVVIRGGGSQLDLSVFDAEVVGRAISRAPVPVVTGIGHELDHTVADQAAAVAQKTPTAAGEWLVSVVREFAERVEGARVHIRREAHGALVRADDRLAGVAATLAGVRGVLANQRERLANEERAIADRARSVVTEHGRRLDALADWFSSMGVDQTLERGFALVTTADGETVVRSVSQLSPGDRLAVRLADGTVPVIVEDS